MLTSKAKQLKLSINSAVGYVVTLVLISFLKTIKKLLKANTPNTQALFAYGTVKLVMTIGLKSNSCSKTQ